MLLLGHLEKQKKKKQITHFKQCFLNLPNPALQAFSEYLIHTNKSTGRKSTFIGACLCAYTHKHTGISIEIREVCTNSVLETNAISCVTVLP